MLSRRTVAVVLVVVVLLGALIVSARLNPVYQSRAVVSVGPVADKGPDSLAQNVVVARSPAVTLAARARQDANATIHVGVVDAGALEFRARSRDPVDAAEAANAYAQAYLEVRRAQLIDGSQKDQGPESDRIRRLSPRGAPSVVVAARPATSPLSPWPSEPWAVAGLALIALALAVPNRQPGD